MNQFQYQIPLAAKITASLENQPKPVVLACTTSGGKSFIVAHLLEHFFKHGHERSGVFLGSNQTVLAKQFHDVLTDYPVPLRFSYSMLKNSQDSQLKIGLPQQLINRPRKITLLILDEAQSLWRQIETNPHSMMTKILKLCQPDMVLLLTGSPSYFTQRKDQYAIHYLSYEDIPNNPARVFSKIDMDLISVADTKNLSDCITSFWRMAKQRRYDVSKFAVIARNIEDAEAVKVILEAKLRLRCLISSSKHDLGSENLEIFKNENYDCLVTVNRIFAGWSCPSLVAILDFTASNSVNRSFQLFSRLLRVKDENTRKVYLRICTAKTYAQEAKALHQIRSLLNRETYSTYTKVEMAKNPLLRAV